ncbi:MAG: sialidase family protein [Pseudonocardiales bacterium]
MTHSRRISTAILAAVALTTASLVASGPASAIGGDSRVSVGSPRMPFAQNKQNEPGLAVNAHDPTILAAGANDEIDLEACNAGKPTTCPFTADVGLSGIYFSFDSGHTWTQPTYTGWTARGCLGPAACVPHVGPIGTLPKYYENHLVSGGDPALAFGPKRGADGRFSWDAGSRLYYANLAVNLSSNTRSESFKGAEAVTVARTDDPRAAAGGDANAWLDPVIVSRQNSALFSDKEEIWADNAASSPFFGNVYICNVAFRSNGNGGAPEPVMFTRSTDGGDTWSGQRQLSSATNNSQTGGRQGCAIRSDSRGGVYVFWAGTDIRTRQSAMFMARSFDGGVSFDRPTVVATVHDVGLFDPATRRSSFDGVAGARTSTFPSADIANGAPTGTDATNEIVLSWPDGTTPSDVDPGPNEQALIQFSLNRGVTWSTAVNAAPAGDRPDFPAVAISPNGTDVYLTYDNFLQPWQSTTADPRLMQGVVRHADVGAAGAFGPFGDLHRGAIGDARGSSQNGLTAEFLGDYNYAVATRDYGAATWNDVRNAADCPAMDAYRQAYVEAVLAGTTLPTKPAPNTDCPPTFGNSDIYGGSYLDPTP